MKTIKEVELEEKLNKLQRENEKLRIQISSKEEIIDKTTEYIGQHFTDDEVEILEEEKKIPEKLNTWYGIEPVNLDSPTTFKDNSKYIDFNTEMFFDKINEIIDYLKSKGDE